MVTGILHCAWCLYTCLDLIFDAIAYITFQAIDATCHAHSAKFTKKKQKKTINKQKKKTKQTNWAEHGFTVEN